MKKSPHEQAVIAFRLMKQEDPDWLDFPRYWMAFNALYNYVRKDGESEKSAIGAVIKQFMNERQAADCLVHLWSQIGELVHLPPGDDRLDPDDPDYRANTKRLAAELNATPDPTLKLVKVMQIVYQVRCNLMHGSKDDRVLRDKQLVRVCTPVLKKVVPMLVNIMDEQTTPRQIATDEFDSG